MAKVNVVVTLPFVSSKESFGVGDKILLDQDVAYKFAKKGVVEFINKKQFSTLDKEIIDKAKAEQEEQIEKEKQAAAILYKDELLGEKQNLLSRVDEINTQLEIEDVIIKKEDHQNLLDMAETVEVSKDEFLSLVGESTTVVVPKLEHDKLLKPEA